MYKLHKKVNHNNQLKHVILENNKHGNTLKIHTELGGAVHQLNINNKCIIKEFDAKNHNEKFLSSILFPYANRVNKGVFLFEKNTYNLPLNETTENHAIHGLIYDKKFKLVGYNLFDEYATIKFSLSETHTRIGLLFNYKIDLVYQITETSLNLEVNVYNKGVKPFPFSLGWHPYFYNSNEENGILKFKSNQKIEFNDKMIPSTFKTVETNELIINKNFDDCYKLKEGEVMYCNDNYKLLLTSTAKVNYLQVFTPKNKNTVAIEFMTAPPDSFNNKVDINILEPKKKYNLKWSIILLSHKNQ